MCLWCLCVVFVLFDVLSVLCCLVYVFVVFGLLCLRCVYLFYVVVVRFLIRSMCGVCSYVFL